jgi:hypothetical protein
VAASVATPTFVVVVELVVAASEKVVFVSATALMSANAPTQAIDETQ